MDCGIRGALSLSAQQETQERRRAALPDAGTLKRNLDLAVRDLPFREGLFTPFLEAVERARSGPLLQLEDLRGSAFALKVNALLIRTDEGWAALAPLRGVSRPAELAATARAAGHELLDLKMESNNLVNSYRNDSLRLIALGLLCIAVLLAWGLRSVSQAGRVLIPVLAAVVLAVSILLLWGTRFTLFNLVALLLVVGIGLNYALFFNRPVPDPHERQRTLLSLAVCGATTLSAFGCLAFSQTPLLRDRRYGDAGNNTIVRNFRCAVDKRGRGTGPFRQTSGSSVPTPPRPPPLPR